VSTTPPTPLDTTVAPFRLTEPDGATGVELADLLTGGAAVLVLVDDGAIDDARSAMLRELGDRLRDGGCPLVLVTPGESAAARSLAAVRAVRWLCDPDGEAAAAFGIVERRKRLRKGGRRGQGVFIVDRAAVLRLAFQPQEPDQWIPASFVASRLARLAAHEAAAPAAAQAPAEPGPPVASDEEMDDLVRSLARALGISGTALTQLATASRFRDLGMTAVPDEIITKSEPLTDEEWDVVHAHPERSAEMLGPSPLFSDVRAIVRATHEHFDGSGYPHGLSGDEIPLGARIVLVAETYLALRAMGDTDTIAHLRERAGTLFDPAVVEALASILGQATLRAWQAR
jgi:HD domain-containing protein